MLLKVNREGLEAALASIGAHADSLPIFAHKAEIIPFKLLGVRTPAANIIKQEMLAVGGDAVTPVGAVTRNKRQNDELQEIGSYRCGWSDGNYNDGAISTQTECQ